MSYSITILWCPLSYDCAGKLVEPTVANFTSQGVCGWILW